VFKCVDSPTLAGTRKDVNGARGQSELRTELRPRCGSPSPFRFPVPVSIPTIGVDMNPRVLELVSQCKTRPGATIESLEELSASRGITLPADYVSLLSFSNGFEGFVGSMQRGHHSFRRCHETRSLRFLRSLLLDAWF
jgi:hypothetical protein